MPNKSFCLKIDLNLRYEYKIKKQEYLTILRINVIFLLKDSTLYKNFASKEKLGEKERGGGGKIEGEKGKRRLKRI